ncbi:hydroxymethylglutaryl-CoA lyase [Sphingomonas cavernae]|uniref:Hydroxymethylglutaryl-CoA lyase n=1 Tax=Sphingomonas cavernae TaxID=2320861 RepID=A0A418WJP1_9SPHN|nr:hydroxymethylglutaryl-CoA lyase [Sphingomonas cavernae]RJF90271.1 hydroxymethylglutaryl-CoA lyase [Sphingomonas cavernae]
MTQVTMIEVGPRDGFQPIVPFIPTARKIEIIENLYAAGVRRMEAAAFVSPSAVPQMADAPEILAAAAALPGLDAQVLVPTARQADRAIAAGARHLVFVVSVSETHNRNNVRRSPAESVEEYVRLVEHLPGAIRLNVATAFDCPFEGRVSADAVFDLLDRLVPLAPSAEIALCDTTGRATPGQVMRLFGEAAARYPGGPSWVFHGHDTYGVGAANAFAAYQANVRAFDASVGGLGGCPFAPGATGNVATEDLVWMFENMGIATGIMLDRLVETAHDVTTIVGGQTGGRVRRALAAAHTLKTSE